MPRFGRSKWSLWVAVIAAALFWMVPSPGSASDPLPVDWGCATPAPPTGNPPFYDCAQACLPPNPPSPPLLGCRVCVTVEAGGMELLRACP